MKFLIFIKLPLLLTFFFCTQNTALASDYTYFENLRISQSKSESGVSCELLEKGKASDYSVTSYIFTRRNNPFPHCKNINKELTEACGYYYRVREAVILGKARQSTRVRLGDQSTVCQPLLPELEKKELSTPYSLVSTNGGYIELTEKGELLSGRHIVNTEKLRKKGNQYAVKITLTNGHSSLLRFSHEHLQKKAFEQIKLLLIR